MNITKTRKSNKIMALLIALFVTLGFLFFSSNSVQAATLKPALSSTTFSNLTIISKYHIPTSFNVRATKGATSFLWMTKTAYFLTIKEN